MLFLNRSYDADPGVPTRASIFGRRHWNLWRTRQQPFKDFGDGTQVVLVDTWPGGSRLTWQVRASDVIATSYASKNEAIRYIAQGLGIPRSEVWADDYTTNGPDEGVLLAWGCQPVRRINIGRPQDMKFRPNGWLTEDSPTVLRRWGVSNSSNSSRRVPTGNASSGGAGRLPLAERLVVEEWAMARAEDWCHMNGWPIVDKVSTRKSWDLEARKRRSGKPLFVEAKGTIGKKFEVEVTKGEVEHAQLHTADTVLVVVTEISLKRGSNPSASGGKLHIMHPWSPKLEELTATKFRWKSDRPPTVKSP